MNWNPCRIYGKVPPPAVLPRTPKLIRCPNCNAPVRPNQRQCEYCGTWFEGLEITQEERKEE